MWQKWAFSVIPRLLWHRLLKILRLEISYSIWTSNYWRRWFLYGSKNFNVVLILFSFPATWLHHIEKNAKNIRYKAKAGWGTCTTSKICKLAKWSRFLDMLSPYHQVFCLIDVHENAFPPNFVLKYIYDYLFTLTLVLVAIM